MLARGTVLASGAGADAGKLVKPTAGTETAAYDILLDPSIDTSAAFSDGSVTGSIARAGSFKGAALVVPTGINAATLTTRLRELGISWKGRSLFPLPPHWRQRHRRQSLREAIGQPCWPWPILAGRGRG